jgi:hypothetical protein
MTEVRADFAAAYDQAGRPRIAVYVNRWLVGDVRERPRQVIETETKTTDMQTVEVSGKATEEVEVSDTVGSEKEGGYQSKEAFKESAEGEARTTLETGQETTVHTIEYVDPPDEGVGHYLEQQWAWRLEDAIQQPLLDANAHVVERAVIMRLAAAARNPDPLAEMPVKTIEMDALADKADVLVEIRISSFPDEKRGYIYRQRAYNVRTGQLLYSSSSRNWPRSRRVKGEWKATDTGYERAAYPDPDELGRYLAQDMMEGLASGM